jgi:hypothetical protein
LINVNDDLLVAITTITLGLSARASNKVFLLFLGNGLCVGPFLVSLALIGLAGLKSTAKGELLLSLLTEVLSIGDAVVLWLGSFDDLIASLSITGQSLLLVSLGDSLSSLLISELSASLLGTPAVVGLLLGFTTAG